MHESAMPPPISSYPTAEAAVDPASAIPCDSHAGDGSAKWSIAWAPVVLLSLLSVLLYHGIAVKLVTDWHNLPDFSHGFLIPFFAAFLLWDKRREIAGTPLAPSWAGLSLVVLGLCELLLGI